MSLFVNSNISSLTAQRNITNIGNSLSTSFERLSSGFRINSAADDAAGLQISDRMTTQVNGLGQAVRNANDGISVLQTAEGALGEISNNLQRIRQLSVQSGNGIYSKSDIGSLQKEANSFLEEIDRIASKTQFGGINLLDGGYIRDFLVGANSGQKITVDLTQFSTGFGLQGLGIKGLNIDNDGTFSGANIDPSIIIGASTPPNSIVYYSNIASLPIVGGTYRFAVSNDAGATYTEVSVELNGNADIRDADISNDPDAIALSNALNNVLGATGSINSDSGGAITVQFLGGAAAISNIRVAENSSNPASILYNSGSFGNYENEPGASISLIDGALSRVNGARAQIGALQNRFQSTIRNLSNISENVSAARSQIRDTDYALETANLTRNQIIQQASVSVLAQANNRPQAALSLLT